jgi:hypothetical protein
VVLVVFIVIIYAARLDSDINVFSIVNDADHKFIDKLNDIPSFKSFNNKRKSLHHQQHLRTRSSLLMEPLATREPKYLNTAISAAQVELRDLLSPAFIDASLIARSNRWSHNLHSRMTASDSRTCSHGGTVVVIQIKDGIVCARSSEATPMAESSSLCNADKPRSALGNTTVISNTEIVAKCIVQYIREINKQLLQSVLL